MSDNSQATSIAQIDKYLAEADRLKYGDPNAILKAAQAATYDSQILGDFRRYTRAMIHQSWAYGFLNQYELSLTHALEALALARDERMMDLEALAVGVIAFNFLKFGDLQEATHLFEHERMLGEQLGDYAIQGMALNDLSVVKMELGDFYSAAELLRQAVKLMPADDHEGMDRSIAHLNLAYAAVKSDQHDEAIEHAQQVLKRVKDGPKFISDAHLWIAYAHLGRGELEPARKRIEQARACVEEANPPIYNDNVEQLTAELLTAEGRHAEASHVWEYMYEMAIQRQELDYAISALNHLKTVYERLNDSAGLISAYKRLAEDIPIRQRQSSELRFSVLRMVFAMDKETLEAELHLSQHKSAILKRLSHQFRTPLNIIQSSSYLLEQADKLSLQQRQMRLQRISAQVQHMTIILDEIMEVLSLEDDNTLLLLSTFQLEDLAQSALRQTERYNISNLPVEIHILPDQTSIQGPRKALQMILSHLLTNALRLSQDMVKADLEFVEQMVVMRVTAQGVMPQNQEQPDITRVLTRPPQFDEVAIDTLGLAMINRLVRQLRGKIEYNGNTVAVRIPIT